MKKLIAILLASFALSCARETVVEAQPAPLNCSSSNASCRASRFITTGTSTADHFTATVSGGNAFVDATNDSKVALGSAGAGIAGDATGLYIPNLGSSAGSIRPASGGGGSLGTSTSGWGALFLSAANGSNLISLTDSTNAKTGKLRNNNDSFEWYSNANAKVLSVDGSGRIGVVGEIDFVSGHVGDSLTAPTISSGFGTSPSVASHNGTVAFTVNVGTGGVATSGVIGLPAATNGWVCQCTDITTNSATVFITKQTASATTSCTVGNFNTSAAAAAWVASDILHCIARAR